MAGRRTGITGGAWISQLQQALDERCPMLATIVNSGKGSMWSQWGVENLDEQLNDK